MILFPAIDLKDGQCVRLEQGAAERETVYATDPLGRAEEFAAEGAEWIHVVDLDAGADIDTVHSCRAGERAADTAHRAAHEQRERHGAGGPACGDVVNTGRGLLRDRRSRQHRNAGRGGSASHGDAVVAGRPECR